MGSGLAASRDWGAAWSPRVPVLIPPGSELAGTHVPSPHPALSTPAHARHAHTVSRHQLYLLQQHPSRAAERSPGRGRGLALLMRGWRVWRGW